MKNTNRRTYKQGPILDSPVEYIRKQIPRGDGNWPGYEAVYNRLSQAAFKMSENPRMLCSDEHVTLMAILGCGHEETMKGEMHRLYGRGYIM